VHSSASKAASPAVGSLDVTKARSPASLRLYELVSNIDLPSSRNLPVTAANPQEYVLSESSPVIFVTAAGGQLGGMVVKALLDVVAAERILAGIRNASQAASLQGAWCRRAHGRL